MHFQFIDEYAPGTVGGACFFCRANKRPGEQLIHTGIEVEYVGWAVVCSTCVTELGRLIGLPSLGSVSSLEEQVARLRERLDEATVRADAAETALDALRRYELVAGVATGANADAPRVMSK